MILKKQTVAIIRSNYSTHGGIEKVTLNCMEGLLSAGVKLTLLTYPGQNWPISHKNLKIISLGISRGNRFIQALLFNRAVNKYLSANHFDIILSLDKMSQFTHLRAGGTHKSFLKTKNENSNAIERIFRKTSFFHSYVLYLEKQGFSNPRLKKIWCISNLVKDDICKDYAVDKDKIQIIPGGIDWKKIGEIFEKRYETAQELSVKHNISLEKNYLLFLGSGFSRKGLDTGIRGLHSLPDSYDLIVVGKGSQQNYAKLALDLGLSERIHFLGAQENGWKYASLCKALILPSHYEPFGLAAAEAQAMGLPVLVSNKTGYVDCLSVNQNGVILQDPVNDENIKKSFKKLLYLIENPKMTAKQIRNSVKHLDNEFILKKAIQDFMEVQLVR